MKAIYDFYRIRRRTGRKNLFVLLDIPAFLKGYALVVPLADNSAPRGRWLVEIKWR